MRQVLVYGYMENSRSQGMTELNTQGIGEVEEAVMLLLI